ncbi:MAG TPA: PRC-barrel domain-containing protein, partial [Alphaproteobacteria bacterium]|nr:PRC-barrel domain-containing protein [Alphaproteobacteria bacterium]
GATVVNNANETVGEINDLLVDENGMVQAAVIGVGGFLGIGEKDVAVPFKELKVTRQNDGDIDKVLANFNKDQLKQAPEFKTMAQQRRETDRTRTTPDTTAPGTRTPSQ